jgi:hypothetical protein
LHWIDDGAAAFAGSGPHLSLSSLLSSLCGCFPAGLCFCSVLCQNKNIGETALDGAVDFLMDARFNTLTSDLVKEALKKVRAQTIAVEEDVAVRLVQHRLRHGV